MASTGSPPEDTEVPPVVDGLPVVGVVPWLRREQDAFFERIAGRYDADVVGYRFFDRPLYLLTGPDAVRDVYGPQNERFSKVQHGLAEMLPHGLLTTRGEEWQRHRRALNPAFSGSRLPDYVDDIAAVAERQLETWTDGEPVAIDQWCGYVTLNAVLDTVLDVDVDGRFEEIHEALLDLPAGFDVRKWSVLLSDRIPVTLPPRRRSERAIAELRSIAGDVLARRRREKGAPEGVVAALEGAAFDDAITRTEIEDEIVNFLFTGSDASRLAFTYVLFLLANDPDVQSKVQTELDDELDGPPTSADLDRLTYTERVVTEGLRLYPPVSAMTRISVDDVEVGGYEFPEWTLFKLSPWLMHRDERWFDDPEAFRPERWGDDAGRSRPEFAYFPFGGGRRHCIGSELAKRMIVVGVATTLRRFDLEPVTEPPLDLTVRITLQPTGSVEVIPRTREGA